MTRRTLAIVGASLAGAKAAEAARSRVRRPYPARRRRGPAPYERPPLSKAILRGEAEPESARLHPEGFYDDHDIELVHDQAVALDTVSRRSQRSPGRPRSRSTAPSARHRAEPRPAGRARCRAGRRPPPPHRRRLRPPARCHRRRTRVAVIGAGWIGSEVAASARQMGADVVLVDRRRPAPASARRPRRRRLRPPPRRPRRAAPTRHRRGGCAASRVEEVVLTDGTAEAADLVVVGIGVTPRPTWPRRPASRRQRDRRRPAPRVQRRGHLRRRRRRQCVAPALPAARAGRALGERPQPGQDRRPERGRPALDVYDRLPYFFSDQYDLGMEYVGLGTSSDEVVVRGDLDPREFIAFWHRDGVVTAAMNVNVWDVVEDLKAIVASGTARRSRSARRPGRPARRTWSAHDVTSPARHPTGG